MDEKYGDSGALVGIQTEEPFRVLVADLHIHTCLSPCAALDMTPVKIVREALKKNLSIIAITDHNSAQNVAAVIAAARDSDLSVIPGIEVTTSEEVHVIGLFEKVISALSMQKLVYDNLQPGENDEDLFGIQVVANEFDEVEEINKRLLMGATLLSLDDVISAIHERGGLAVAAHVDRESFSILSQLGFIPESLKLDVVEISKRMTLTEARAHFSQYEWVPFITASDAHFPKEIGVSPLCIKAARPDISELRLALAGQEERRVLQNTPTR
jgi:PHP family Zn ribbon phosphoesterase